MPRLGTVIFWIFIIGVVIYVFQNPAGAGATVHGWITAVPAFLHGLSGK